MYDQLKSYLDGFFKLCDTAASEIRRNFRIQRFPKGSLVASAGEITKEAHFVIKGCYRYYHKFGNKAITYWFEFENYFVTSVLSFTTREPSREYIQAIEDSVVLSITYDDLLNLYNNYHQWEKLGRLVSEDFARRLQNRIVGLQIPNATLRYLHLLQTQPQIIQRVPLVYISSYLGISRETLSRIRSKIRQ